MSMRLAERQRSYRTLEKRTYTTTLRLAEFYTSTQRVERLEFSPGFSVICGGNGAGKSTALGALWRTIESTPTGPSNLPRTPTQFERITVAGTHNGSDWETAFHVSDGLFQGNCPAEVVYLDSSSDTDALLRRIREDDEPSDLLEGVDPSPLPDPQLKMLSYVLRRTYDEVLVYEVTSFSEDDSPTPLFEVLSHGRRYSLTEMGRGELAACYLLWRIHQIASGSIVLLEEPESHLASYSQGALTDAIVTVAASRDLAIVASSHSPGVIEKLPDAAVTLISASPTFSIRCGLPKAQIGEQLGLRPSKAILLVTEDGAAAHFVRALLFALDRELYGAVEIRISKSGESGVAAIMNDLAVPVDASQFVVLGVLDGDQRPGPSAWEGEIGFLPGDAPPDELMRHAANRWRVDEDSAWTPALPGGAESLKLALERIDGIDHHDWLIELAKIYGTAPQVTHCLVDLLLQQEEIKTQAGQLVDWIRQRANGS